MHNICDSKYLKKYFCQKYYHCLIRCNFFIRWTVGIFRKGYTKVLTVDDLYDPLKSDKSNILGDRLEKLVFYLSIIFILYLIIFNVNYLILKRQWEKELKRVAKSNQQPSLPKTIFRTFAKEIFFMGILHVILEFICR